MLGTANKRQRVQPPDSTQELGRSRVVDADGREVELAELWRDRPAVLVWLRHYG
ncbi:MAG: hypothetical protein ACJ76S_03140 [Solirubrobacteraceae bacterium]